MKKVGIRLLLSLILVTMLVVAGTAPVSAKGKPVKLGITITGISDGCISFDYFWNKIGAHYSKISLYKAGVPLAINSTEQVDLGGRTPSKSGSMWFTNPEITCNSSYSVIMWLYRKPTRVIHGASVSDTMFFNCPPPTQLFGECFCGVPKYSLPAGWFTTNSTIVGVTNGDAAGGAIPELLLWYGWPETATQDYWVRTPTIDATAATTALNLTFKHALYTFVEGGVNFTYSVEVSTDGGSNWTAVLEETVTESQWPEPVVGPETANIDLSAYGGNDILIRWRLRGYTYYTDGWFIDDIIVDGY